MRSFGLSLFLIVVTTGYTQAPDTLWTKTYGGTNDDVGYSIQQTSDGGYIIAGYTESFGAGGQDVWLLKTDSSGDTVWTKTYGGAEDDWATAVRLTSDGGYIILANTEVLYGTVIWLIKTDHIGDTTWTEIYDLPDGLGGDVQQTSDGGYIITGSADPSWLLGGIQLLKTDQNGNEIWCHSIDWGWGGAGGNSVRETCDGGFIVTGYIIPEPHREGGISRLIKTDANGGVVWRESYAADNLRSVKQTADSGYVACGHISYPNHLLWIVETNSNGDTLWTRGYGSYAIGMVGYSLQFTNDNAYILTGGCGYDVVENPDVFLFKTDANGDSLWCVVYGNSAYPDCGNEVLQANDGGYIAVGYTESYGAGGFDVWLIKTAPDVGIAEQSVMKPMNEQDVFCATIFRGPLQLPEGKKCVVYDITGRVIEPHMIAPGIYFVETDNKIVQKVVKIK